MKITVIYGCTVKNPLYKYIEILLKKFKKHLGNIIVDKFYLCENPVSPECKSLDDLSHEWFLESHFGKINNIVNSLNECDIIILASPIISGKVSPSLKLLLDYLSYNMLSKEMSKVMFTKIGIIITSSNNFVERFFSYPLKNKLKFFGITKNNLFSNSLPLIDMNNLSLNELNKINDSLRILSLKASAHYRKIVKSSKGELDEDAKSALNEEQTPNGADTKANTIANKKDNTYKHHHNMKRRNKRKPVVTNLNSFKQKHSRLKNIL